MNLKNLKRLSCSFLSFKTILRLGLKGLRGSALGVCLMSSLLAFEIKFSLESFLDTAVTIGFTPKESPSQLIVTRSVIPLDFMNEIGLNFLFNEQHLLELSWELSFMNQSYLQLSSDENWKTVWTERSLGERELKNEIMLDYIFQSPLPVFWVMPFIEYNSRSGTHGANFNLSDSFFTYHGYRTGLQLGYHNARKYFVRFRDESLNGWTVSTTFSHGSKFFDSNNFLLTDLTIPSNSVLSNQTNLIISLNRTDAQNSLNYRDLKVDFKTFFQQKNMSLELGYGYEVNFIPNQFILTDDFSLTNSPARASFQNLFLAYQMSFIERKVDKKGYSGNYLGEFRAQYFFEADFYDDQAVKLDYTNPPSLIESVHRLGEFEPISTSGVRVSGGISEVIDDLNRLHHLAMYVQNDDEKFLHLLSFEPRLNYLPNRAFSIYYGLTIVDFRNFILPAARELSSAQGEYRQDFFHNVRLTFDFFDFIGFRASEFYMGYNVLMSNDTAQDPYRNLFTIGFNLTYSF